MRKLEQNTTEDVRAWLTKLVKAQTWGRGKRESPVWWRRGKLHPESAPLSTALDATA